MTAYNLITFDSSAVRKKQEASSGLTIDFTAVNIGGSALPISEGTAGALDINGVVLEGVATPVAGTDAANKNYVDGVAQGLDVKHSAKACTTAALTVTPTGSGIAKLLTADAVGLLSLDGVSTWTDVANDSGSINPFSTGVRASRVLVKDQAATADNGIYAVQEKGDGGTPFILIRAEDADQDTELTAAAFTFIEEGTACADTGWVLQTNDPITVDVTGQSWSQFSGAGSFSGGDGINLSGSVIEVDLLDANSGLELPSGELKVATSTAGSYKDAASAILIDSSGLYIKLDGATLAGTADSKGGAEGLKVANSGITEQELAPSTAHAGILLDGNGYSVDLQAAGVGTGGLEFDAVGSLGELKIIAGDGIELTASGVAIDFTDTLTNDNASPITVGQVVYIKADGDVDLAVNDITNFDDFKVGIVQDASIAAAASGEIITRTGALVGGFSGLTIGKRQYVSTTAGDLQEDLTGFVATDHVYTVGRAVSATEINFEPHYEFEF